MNKNKQFMPEATEKERLNALKDNADKMEKTTYQKKLSFNELAERCEDLAKNCIKLSSIDDEIKLSNTDFKGRKDPLKTANKNLLAEIKTEQTTVDGTLFHLSNHDTGIMETYDEDGYLISSRRLRPEEKQTNIFQMQKTAN